MCGKITYSLLVLRLIYMFSRFMFKANYLLWRLQPYRWVSLLKLHFSSSIRKCVILPQLLIVSPKWTRCWRTCRSFACNFFELFRENVYFRHCSSIRFVSFQSWVPENLQWQCTLFQTLELGVTVRQVLGIVLVSELTFIISASYLVKLLSNLPGRSSALPFKFFCSPGTKYVSPCSKQL